MHTYMYMYERTFQFILAFHFFVQFVHFEEVIFNLYSLRYMYMYMQYNIASKHQTLIH